jgi:hypothetical protein
MQLTIKMKTIKIAVFVFILLATLACNKQKGKNAETDSATVNKPITERSDIKKTDKTEQEEFKPCDSLVKEILTTSPRYKKLTKGLYKAVVKNGGQSFGIRLERSPNHKQDSRMSYSKTYDFAVYEVYTDRELNTARFSFNPINKQLYEYDEVHDQLKTIEFDRNLLLKYDTLCR